MLLELEEKKSGAAYHLVRGGSKNLKKRESRGGGGRQISKPNKYTNIFLCI